MNAGLLTQKAIASLAPRRAKRPDVFQSAVVKPDGLSVCLDCWKTFMLSDDRDLSASRMHLHGGSEDSHQGYDSDVYAEQRKADMKVGEATDAMIDSLRALHRWAIYKKCGIASVWNFPSADFMHTLIDAEEELRQKLKNNVATAMQFV